MTKRICLTLLIVIILFAPSLTVEAAPVSQGGNLIPNGDFEAYSGDTPNNWAQWYFVDNCKGNEQLNYACQPNGFYREAQPGGAAFIHTGGASLTIRNNWDPWTAGAKQIVNAPAGSTVRLTAYSHLWAAQKGWASNVPSDSSAAGFSRVGIDPTGADYPSNNQIVWSGTISPHDTWQPVSVDATVGAGGKVTVILYSSYRGYSRYFMTASWDDASLVVVSSSGGNPSGNPAATSVPPTNPPPKPLPPFVMPTAQADGSVVYIVQAGDSLWRIAANTGLTIDQIKAMNGLTSNTLSVGQHLIIGQGATATPGPTDVPTAAPPTATPQTSTSQKATAVAAASGSANTSEVCVLLYNDANGNGLLDSNEGAIAGGQLTILDANTGAPVQAYTTTGGDTNGHCFKDLPVGAYTVAATAPAGYNPTTATSVLQEAKAGEHYKMNFGAQPSSNAPPAGGKSTGLGSLGAGRSALFGALGVVLLLLAAGVAGFLIIRRR
jgi:LysM repeat protein